MKKYLALILAVVILLCSSGCKNTNTVLKLDNGLSQYIDGRTESEYNPIPISKQLDLLLTKYTGGLQEVNKNPDDINKNIPDDEKDGIINNSKNLIIADNVSEVTDILKDAFAKTEEVVNIKTKDLKLDSNDFSNIIFEDIADSEMIDYMGTRSFSLSDIQDPINSSIIIYRVEFTYEMPVNQVKKMKIEAKKEVKNVVKNLHLDGLTDYQKVVKIRKYLCDTVTYPSKEPYKEPTYTAYGALIDGSAVCDGYARATEALFEECGVKGMYIWGPVIDNRGLHAWNLVKLDNKWYQMDITWDDALSSDTYFLVTDAFMKSSRSWDYSKYPKSATTAYKQAS